MSQDKIDAARQIQRMWRGFLSRKQTNIYGRSQGKEIEIYLPLGIQKKGSGVCSLEMVGNYKSVICESDLFSIQIDHMSFSGERRLKIPEIVTAPFRQAGEACSNLHTEKEIDEAVSDFLALIETFTKDTAASSQLTSALKLTDLMDAYNLQHPKHPLQLHSTLKKYLANPVRKALFSDNIEPVLKHKDIDLCLIYQPDCFPKFDKTNTPCTLDSAKNIDANGYTSGKLLVHVQTTFSLPIEDYGPEMVTKYFLETFHNTEQQLDLLREAHARAQQFIMNHPLPIEGNQKKILGLLTLCVEQILTVSKSQDYVGLHEKELNWFDTMFQEHLDDIKRTFCVEGYSRDYRSLGGGYGYSNIEVAKYDVIFDLFGDFSNGKNMSQDDINHPLTLNELEEMHNDKLSSWKDIYEGHASLSGRTHLCLQKVINKEGVAEYHPLFEARRIGLMTVEEFQEGKSQVTVVPSEDSTSYNP